MKQVSLLDDPLEKLIDELKVIISHARTVRSTKVLKNDDLTVLRKYQDQLHTLYLQHKLLLEVIGHRYEHQPEPYQFKPGDKVIYVPVYANGDINHPNCERGVVSSVSQGDNGIQTVWVLYDGEDTGAVTAYDCLVLDV